MVPRGYTKIMHTTTFALKTLIFIASLLGCGAKAQIGYQVSLLDPSSGTPRANENVEIEIEVSDNEGKSIIKETKEATSNEFGLLTLKIGDAQSFSNMDWSKLPLWISAKVGEVVIGKSQILNVPVAEYAKASGTLTTDILCSKVWTATEPDRGTYTLIFKNDGIGEFRESKFNSEGFKYWLMENGSVLIQRDNRGGYGRLITYFAKNNWLFDGELIYK